MNRNRLLEIAKHKNEALLMIDSDIIFTPIQVEVMERHLENVPAVTGVYTLGNRPNVACLYKRSEEDYELTDIPKTFAPVDACGAGFFGLSKKLVQTLPKNAFDGVLEDGVQHGEDISVCHRINKMGLKIYCDPELKVGHLREEAHYAR